MKYSQKKEFYIYALLDTRKPGYYNYSHWVFHYEPFYVGKGKGNRAEQHIWEAARRTGQYNKFKSRIISKIITEMEENPRIIIKKRRLTEKQALDTEKKLISIIGRRNLGEGPLVNLTDGGDGVSNRIYTKK